MLESRIMVIWRLGAEAVYSVWARQLPGALAILLATVGVSMAAGKPFTVAEEIALAHFGDPYGGTAKAVQFSPDGDYVAALTERGRLDLNRPEDTLRIYRVEDLRAFLRRRTHTDPPMPSWVFSRSTDRDGPIIAGWRWLADSSGVTFLERGAHGSNRLLLADLRTRKIEALTPEGASIKAFDIRDRQHFVYALADPGLLENAIKESYASAIVGTGRPLSDLLFPVDQNPQMALWSDRSMLWAVVGGNPFPVTDRSSGNAVVLFAEGHRNLALSADGESLITVLPVEETPKLWERLYPPPFEASPNRIRSGKQDLSTFGGYSLVSRYVHIGLRNGAVRALSAAPTGFAAGWDSGASPAWSPDGKVVALPNVFVDSDNHAPARACMAITNLDSSETVCVDAIQGPDEHGAYRKESHYVNAISFEGPDGRTVRVNYSLNFGDSHDSTQFWQDSQGHWVRREQVLSADLSVHGGIQVTVKQGLNTPPVLVATDSKSRESRVIWDPNPQLKGIELGEATVLKWKDKSGREWKGGLFKPVPYESGRRYPLVIQTHGFSESGFRPSGIYPTAFAARALSGAGLVVLQSEMCPILGTPEEGSCNVEGIEAAVHELVRGGLVDAEQIGIIGFSRTCFHVMETLTSSSLHIKAASITDGVMAGYLQYMDSVDGIGGGLADEYDAMIGTRPFGQGLVRWFELTPLFNMTKVAAALQVVSEGRADLTFMWEPYAAMRYLHKPVDLILLNNDEHVLSNPAARMTSQGGSVDWFRFWLQNYEDPDPAKTEQYTRWRELRKLQTTQDAERASASRELVPAH